jgi:hypothetical protein
MKDCLTIEELCMSCRALGRNMEDTMIAHAVNLLLEDLPSDTVNFVWRVGPRNEPARAWFQKFADMDVPDGVQIVRVPASRFAAVSEVPGITIEVGVYDGAE